MQKNAPIFYLMITSLVFFFFFLLTTCCCLRFEIFVCMCYGHFQGDFKAQEDKKHRATYQALTDSEKKLQFFSARQIACRLLGSRDYLCQKVIVFIYLFLSVSVYHLAYGDSKPTFWFHAYCCTL